MPRGGHFGLWKPVAKDIFRSRWKRFYKRCYRDRATKGNTPDRPGPHLQPNQTPDGVPEPWRLLYSLNNFEAQRPPPDARGITLVRETQRIFMQPAMRCVLSSERHAILRALDGGRNGGPESGFGRMETSPWPQNPDHVPQHILNVLKANAVGKQQSRAKDGSSRDEDDDDDQTEAEQVNQVEEQDQVDDPPDFYAYLVGKQDPAALKRAHGTFPVRRVQELMEEYTLVWDGGLKKPRDLALDDGERGHFPFVDEQASLISEMALRDILKVSHRTKSRRHPKWQEIQYEFKRGHQTYLRRRQMLLDEAKSRMGVVRQALADV